jgi:hypothetical protein
METQNELLDNLPHQQLRVRQDYTNNVLQLDSLANIKTYNVSLGRLLKSCRFKRYKGVYDMYATQDLSQVLLKVTREMTDPTGGFILANTVQSTFDTLFQGQIGNQIETFPFYGKRFVLRPLPTGKISFYQVSEMGAEDTSPVVAQSGLEGVPSEDFFQGWDWATLPMCTTDTLDNSGFFVIDLTALWKYVITYSFYFWTVQINDSKGTSFSTDSNNYERMQSFVNRFRVVPTELLAFPQNLCFNYNLIYDQYNTYDAISTQPSADDYSVNTYRYSLLLIPVPKVPLKGRLVDQRIGYFSTWRPVANPYNLYNGCSLINRLRIKPGDTKKYYIHPSIVEANVPAYQGIIDDLNRVFHEFQPEYGLNTFQLIYGKDLPSDYDHRDIRYFSFLNSDIPGSIWGYGKVLADPRSGEVLYATITVVPTETLSNIAFGQIVLEGGQPKAAALNHRQKCMCQCEPIPNVFKPPTQEEFDILTTDLQIHELGHTLGLRHNFAATFNSVYPPDPTSVMDYPNRYYINDEGIPVPYSRITFGPYDVQALKYGYYYFPEGTTPEEEQAYLQTVAKYTGENYLFVTDQDTRQGNDYRGDVYRASDDMAYQLYEEAVILQARRQGLLQKVIEKKYTPQRYGQAWLSRARSSYVGEEAGRFAAPLGGSVPSPDKSYFEIVDKKTQWNGVLNILAMFNISLLTNVAEQLDPAYPGPDYPYTIVHPFDTWYAPTGEEYTYLGQYYLMDGRISPGPNLYTNARLDVPEYRLVDYFVFVDRIFNINILKRLSYAEEFNNGIGLQNYMCALFLNPGIPDFFPPEFKNTWNQLEFPGLYPELCFIPFNVPLQDVIDTFLLPMTQNQMQQRIAFMMGINFWIFTLNNQTITGKIPQLNALLGLLLFSIDYWNKLADILANIYPQPPVEPLGPKPLNFPLYGTRLDLVGHLKQLSYWGYWNSQALGIFGSSNSISSTSSQGVNFTEFPNLKNLPPIPSDFRPMPLPQAREEMKRFIGVGEINIEVLNKLKTMSAEDRSKHLTETRSKAFFARMKPENQKRIAKAMAHLILHKQGLKAKIPTLIS